MERGGKGNTVFLASLFGYLGSDGMEWGQWNRLDLMD